MAKESITFEDKVQGTGSSYAANNAPAPSFTPSEFLTKLSDAIGTLSEEGSVGKKFIQAHMAAEELEFKLKSDTDFKKYVKGIYTDFSPLERVPGILGYALTHIPENASKHLYDIFSEFSIRIALKEKPEEGKIIDFGSEFKGVPIRYHIWSKQDQDEEDIAQRSYAIQKLWENSTEAPPSKRDYKSSPFAKKLKKH